MKAVLLAAGKGSRLYPITKDISKQMIKISGKPILEYIIVDLVNSGFNDICIVIAEKELEIKKYFKDGKKFGARIVYKIQKRPLGSADATRYAKEFVGKDRFLLYLSDTIIPYGFDRCIAKMLKEKSDLILMTAKVQGGKRKEIGMLETDGKIIKKINEKVENPSSNIAWAGVALFNSDFVFDVIKSLKPSKRQEYDLTDAINMCINNKKAVHFECKKFLDSGTFNGLLETSNFILKNQFLKKPINNIKLKHVFVGENCRIGSNCVIGPYVSIGDNVVIGDNVEIKKSLVIDESNIQSNQKIIDKVVFPCHKMH